MSYWNIIRQVSILRKKEFNMEIRYILGIILLCIQAIIIIPLAIELRKTRSSDGISVISETAWIIAGVGWSIYGYLTDSTTLIISGALATTGSAVVYGLIHKDVSIKDKKKSAIFAIIFTIVMLLSTVVFKDLGLGIFLALFGIIQFLPQLITSVKSIINKDGHGVPLAGTALRALYTLTWCIYAGAWFLWGIAFNEIDLPLAVWGACGFIAFSLQFIAGIIARSHPQDISDESKETPSLPESQQVI